MPKPEATSFLRRLAAVAAAAPDGPAILSAAQPISYGELIERVGRAAAWLRAQGIEPGDRVGLSLGRSADHVIGALATWWAGAAFLPLDPCDPPARRVRLVEEAGLTRVVDALGLADAPLPGPPRPEPDGLAYAIATSGSSGTPRVVLVPHRGVLPFLSAQIEAFRIGPGDRALLALPTTFDASLSEIGTALLSGAALCIAAEGPSAALLRGRRITHVCLPPSLLPRIDPDQVGPSLRTVVIGGEVPPAAAVRRWSERVRLVNVYGPTETTVCASLTVCSPDWEEPSIGAPLPGVSFSLRDPALRPVPPGEPGELCIAGPGVALGYAGQEALTRARFVDLDGVRAYRTGDKAVQRTDGRYTFLGRLDRQVQLRGLRVEPEELEAVLGTHPRVEESAVVKRDLGGRAALVAFVRCDSVPVGALREHLARHVPVWMLPRRFVAVQRLPRTRHGKVDLPALRSQELPAPRRDHPHVPPSTPAERALASIWSRALALPGVGVRDDFFDLGGDSLAALDVIAAAHAVGIELSPGALARGRTIRGALDGRRSAGDRMDRAALCDEAALGEELERLAASAAEASREPRPLPRRILLTGASGTLGSAILKELLARTDAHITCLLRETSRRPPTHERVSLLEGDVTRPRLGLAPESWSLLCEQVDAVYHCAARVHMLEPYGRLAATNVAGTREVLRLVCVGAPKRLHHVSSLSVFVGSDQNTGVVQEADGLRRTRDVYGGYAQTKWVAERILLEARAAGLDGISIYRLGLVTPHSRTGRRGPRDFLSAFLRGLLRLGSYPAGPDLRVDLTPVDFAAAALVHLARRVGAGTFHIANPRPLRVGELIGALRARGACLRPVSPQAWRDELGSDDDPLASLARLALCRSLPGDDYRRLRTLDLFQATGIEFGRERAARGLAGSGIACPSPQALLPVYLRDLDP